MMPLEKNSEKEPWGIATFKRNKETALGGGAVARDLGSELGNVTCWKSSQADFSVWEVMRIQV